jgi:hypothetical protein
MCLFRELISAYTGALRRCSWRCEDQLGKTVFKTAVLISQKCDCVGDACCGNIYFSVRNVRCVGRAQSS